MINSFILFIRQHPIRHLIPSLSQRLLNLLLLKRIRLIQQVKRLQLLLQQLLPVHPLKERMLLYLLIPISHSVLRTPTQQLLDK